VTMIEPLGDIFAMFAVVGLGEPPGWAIRGPTKTLARNA